MKIIWKVIGGIGLLIAISLSGAIGRWIGKASVDVLPVEASEVVDTQRIAKVLNKKFPMMTDPETRIDSAMGLSKELLFKYTLINHTAADLTTQDVNELGKFYLNSVCTTKELQLFVKNGITISYSYFGKDGKPITVISVKPSQCGST